MDLHRRQAAPVEALRQIACGAVTEQRSCLGASRDVNVYLVHFRQQALFGLLLGYGTYPHPDACRMRRERATVPEPLLKWTAPDRYELAVRTSTAPAPRR